MGRRGGLTRDGGDGGPVKRRAGVPAPQGAGREITDANGGVVVTSGPSAAGEPVSVAPGDSFTIGIAWSNWCEAAPAAPLSLALKVSGWESFATVAIGDGGLDPVPPCLGSAEPTVLSWSGLEPQQ